MRRNLQVLLTIGIFATIAFLANSYFRNTPTSRPPGGESSLAENDIEPEKSKAPEAVEAEVAALLEERRQMDETVWAREVEAQKHEETIVKYWDRMLRPEDDKYNVLAEFPFDTITLEAPGESVVLDWGIRRTDFGGEWKTLDRRGWRDFLTTMKDRGYVVDTIEFHQSTFEQPPNKPAVSVYDVLLNVTNDDQAHRWSVKTKLRIEWTDKTDEDGHYIPGTLRTYDTWMLEREGAPAFEHRVLQSNLHELSITIAYDLNRDGLSDIVLPTDNMVLLNRGGGLFEERPLFEAPGIAPPEGVSTAVVADFTGDGAADLLCTASYHSRLRAGPSSLEEGLFLFSSDGEGRFTSPGIRAAPPALILFQPMCLTAGDIDGDGDLDVWLAQYKNPYQLGQMPTPFYDANDGFPSYLLRNRGNGFFDAVTEAAGLAKKRYRRTYGASFVDLDDDGDLDLLVSSDFAGSDLYMNDGNGKFTDVTDTYLDESSNFAMSHTFSDYDGDGALDFYVIGMASATMRRLNQMGLIRPDRPEYLEMRTRMGYGNRMYLARGENTFRQPEFKDSVARSGWSWGATSFDFDSDGDTDVYIANGHVSRKTTKDYCTRFWCHDIYTGNSQPNQAVDNLFKQTLLRTRQGNFSWDGFQKNHLFMNRSGQDFVDVAFLVGTALVEDSRNVLSDDFDGDGRPDLLVNSIHLDEESGKIYTVLHLLANRWPIQNNWIGVRLQSDPGGPSVIGAIIKVRSASGEQLAHIVTGDSFRSQHAPMKHFGLGADTSVDTLEVRWPDGTVEVMENPGINIYHRVSASTTR